MNMLKFSNNWNLFRSLLSKLNVLIVFVSILSVLASWALFLLGEWLNYFGKKLLSFPFAVSIDIIVRTLTKEAMSSCSVKIIVRVLVEKEITQLSFLRRNLQTALSSVVGVKWLDKQSAAAFYYFVLMNHGNILPYMRVSQHLGLLQHSWLLSYLYLPSCFGQERAKWSFGLRVKLPSTHLFIALAVGFKLFLLVLSIKQESCSC